MQFLNKVFSFTIYNVLKGRVILCLFLGNPFCLKVRVAGFSKVGYHTGADRQQRKSSASVSVPSLGSLFYKMGSKYKFADNDKLYFVSFTVTN